MRYSFTNDEKNLLYFFITALFIGLGIAVTEENSAMYIPVQKAAKGIHANGFKSDFKKVKKNKGGNTNKTGKTGRFVKNKKVSKRNKTRSTKRIRSCNQIHNKRGMEKLEEQNLKFPLNMAFADAKELQKIPGIGIKTANNIIDYYRTSQGNNTKEGILKIKGIGPDKFEKIRPYIVIEQPLKTQRPEIELKRGLKTEKSVKKSDFLIRKDINFAGYDDLVKVKGLGPCIANRILKQRDKQGGKFSKIQDLVIVKGIGFKSMSLLRKYFFVSRKNSKPLKNEAKNSVSNKTLAIVSDKTLPIVSKKPLNLASKAGGDVLKALNCKAKGRAWNWKEGYARIFRAYPELNQ